MARLIHWQARRFPREDALRGQAEGGSGGGSDRGSMRSAATQPKGTCQWLVKHGHAQGWVDRQLTPSMNTTSAKWSWSSAAAAWERGPVRQP
jgi:hypothetical protein